MADAEERKVCPGCGSTAVSPNTTRGLKGDTKKYRCGSCGDKFDDPDVEQRERRYDPTHGPARDLAMEGLND